MSSETICVNGFFPGRLDCQKCGQHLTDETIRKFLSQFVYQMKTKGTIRSGPFCSNQCRAHWQKAIADGRAVEIMDLIDAVNKEMGLEEMTTSHHGSVEIDIKLTGDEAWLTAWQLIHRGLRIPPGDRRLTVNGEDVLLKTDGDIERDLTRKA